MLVFAQLPPLLVKVGVAGLPFGMDLSEKATKGHEQIRTPDKLLSRHHVMDRELSTLELLHGTERALRPRVPLICSGPAMKIEQFFLISEIT